MTNDGYPRNNDAYLMKNDVYPRNNDGYQMQDDGFPRNSDGYLMKHDKVTPFKGSQTLPNLTVDSMTTRNAASGSIGECFKWKSSCI